MFAVKAFVLFGLVGVAISIDCISDMGKRCKPKSEVNPYWASKFTTGDPCYLDNNKRLCFVTDSMQHPCSCTAECGCIGAPVVPSCDNSAVPKNPDCTADKKTYCVPNMEKTIDGVTYKNTMCQYCGVDTVACNKVCSRLFTQAEKQEIVDKHNALRRTVAKGLETQGVDGPQPKAADMFELVWDEGLAASAQRWADQCPTYAVGHDKSRLVVGFKSVGQNIAWSGGANSIDKGLSGMVQMWYDEVKLFTKSNVNNFNFGDGSTGHYTQVVWASTKKVGCGFVQWTTTSGSLSKVLVCNYGDAGNMSGAKMYTIGTTGSLCPNGANDGLCKQ